MKIRELNLDQHDDWIEARRLLWPNSAVNEHSDEIKQLLNSKKFFAWAIWDEGSVVAFTEVYLRDFANGCRSMPVPFIEGIWVEESYRGRGLAKKLIDHISYWAKDNGHNEIGSDVLLSNTESISKHQSWGFEETEQVVYFNKKI